MMNVITYGLVAVLLMLWVERFVARRQQRHPEYGAVLTCGLVGIAYFIAMLYAGGFVP